jgi:hypothetical protein
MEKERKINLIEIIKSNEQLIKVFDALDEVGITHYYVGAGAIVQSVWNEITDKQQNYGISDVDIVYYNADDLTEGDEERIAKRIKEKIGEFPLKIDVKNEARVHMWYKEKFGYDIEPYKSLEDAINSWPTTSTSLGIRREGKDEWVVYAPFGIDDIFDLKLISNCRQITEEIYMQKVEKWNKKWNELQFEKWTGEIIPILYPEIMSIKTL